MSEKGVKAIATEHYMQIQFNLFVCNAQWCDYVLYNPKHAAIGNGLFIRRVEYDTIMQARILKAVDECIPIMNKYVQQYHRIFGGADVDYINRQYAQEIEAA